MDRFLEAEAQYAAIVARAEKLAAGAFDTLDGPLIAFLVEAFRVDELASDAATRLDPKAKARGELATVAAERVGYELSPHRPTARWAQGRRFAIEGALDVYRAYSADGDLEGILDAWAPLAASMALEKGYVLDQASQAFRDLCVRLNETAISVHQAELQRLDGQIVPTPSTPEPPPRLGKATPGRSFREIILQLIDKPHAGYAETTKERVRGGLRLLVEAVGDLRPEELTRERVTVFLDLLAQKPAKVSKADLKLKLPQLVAAYANRQDVPRLTQKTREAYVIALNARWNEALQAGGIGDGLPSPFSGRKFRREHSRQRAATGFSANELTAYFSMPAFTEGHRPAGGKGEAVFWIPLLLLFTGARPEEVAQLLVDDIYQDDKDGRWVIRFTDTGIHPVKGRQTLKSSGQDWGPRTFPIPQALLDLGLLAYRVSLKDQNELALFPRLRRKGKRPGIFASFGEWMGGYVYKHGVLQPGTERQPVREFRHTWSTAARASRIPKEAMQYIQGHKDPHDRSASDAYGQRDALGERIADLQLPVDILKLVKPWARS